MRTHKSINLRKALLAGTAIVAVGAFTTGAQAADQELAAAGGDNALTAAAGNTVVERAAATDTDQGQFDVDGDITLGDNTNKAINLDTNSGTLYIYDSAATAGEGITMNGDISVVSGKTLTFQLGSQRDGTAGAVANVALIVDDAANADSFIAGADATTRGGDLVFDVADNIATVTDATVTIDSSILMSGLTVKSGDGGGTGAGIAVAATLGNATTDTLNVTSLTVEGGSGNGDDGGDNTTTVNGAATIGGETLVKGGDDGAATGNGGAASLTFAHTATSTGALTVRGGDGTGTGNGGTAAAVLQGASSFSSITLDDGANSGGATTLTTSTTGTTGEDGFTVNGAINGGEAGEGSLVVTDADDTANDTVTFANAVGGTARLNAVNVGSGTAGGHAKFNSTVNATTITVGVGNGIGDKDVTATFVGDVGSADTTGFNITGGDAAAETATATIQGNLTATTVTFTDGAAAADATLIADAATSGGTITITGNVVGANDDDGILQAGDGTSATNLVVTGTVGGAAANGGDDLEAVNSKTLSTLTFDEAVFADTATTETNSTITFTKGGTLGTSLSNAGTVKVGVGGNLTIASYTDNQGTFVLNAASADALATTADYGVLTINGGTTTLDTDDVTIKVTGLVATDAAVDVLAAGAFDEAKQLVDNSALYTFTAATNGEVTAAQVSTDSITSSKSAQGAIDTLLSVGTAATGELQTVLNTVTAAGTDTVDDVAEAATTVNSNVGGVAAGLSVGNTTAGLNSARLASLRDGSAQTGMAAGNGAEGLKVWGQVFGSTGDQDERDGISGYDVDSYGFAAGVDTENLAEDMVVGLAFSYADTEVDSKGISNAKTEIDSYQLALYGDYDIDERTYLSGQVSYMWSENDTTRNPGGVSSITASGDYDANQWGARAELGRDYDAGEGLKITPSALLNYVHYDADGYTETGAGTANTTTSDADLDVFEVGVGLDATWTVENADGSYFQPTLGLGVRHDLIGDEYSATNQFAGGGSAFAVEGFDPAQTTFDVGAGVTYYTTGGWDLSVEYNYEMKSDYDSHGGLLKAAYNF